MLQKILVVLGLLLLLNSVALTFTSNPTFGLFAMYALSAVLLAYGFCKEKIDLFTAHGPLRFVEAAFFCGCLLYAGLVAFVAFAGYSAHPSYEEKAVVVLGGGLRDGKVSALLAQRLDAACTYHAQNPGALVVVSGGQGPNEPIAEALAMREYLVAQGIPASMILVEDQSTSTKENFLFSRQVLAQYGVDATDPIVFATSNFHCYRSLQYAKMAGFTSVNAVPAPTPVTAVVTCYLREAAAVVHLWLRSWGLEIPVT